MASGNTLQSSTDGATPDDLLVFCSSDDSGSDLSQAVHALYYLPESYKLVVLGNNHDSGMSMMPWADKAISDRITFSETGMSSEAETSPFSYAKAVVYDDKSSAVFARALAPKVELMHGEATADDNAYHVESGNPEALASAVLKVTRAMAA